MDICRSLRAWWCVWVVGVDGRLRSLYRQVLVARAGRVAKVC